MITVFKTLAPTVVIDSSTLPGTDVSWTTAALVLIRSVAVSRREKLQVPEGSANEQLIPNGYAHTPDDV